MIETLKDLEKLLKLCRKQGVVKIAFDDVNVELGDLPLDAPATLNGDVADDPYQGFPAGELTPEQLIFYSSGGMPENDPSLKKFEAL